MIRISAVALAANSLTAYANCVPHHVADTVERHATINIRYAHTFGGLQNFSLKCTLHVCVYISMSVCVGKFPLLS